MLNSSETPLSNTLKAILDSSPESFVLLSANHSVILYNRTLQLTIYRFFNKSLQIGDDYQDYLFESTRQLYANSFQKALNGEITIVQDEAVVGDKTIWLEYKMNPVYDTNHELVGIALYVKNIDAQKKAELALEYTNTTYEAIFANNTEGLILISKDFKVLQFNNAIARRIFENLGKKIYVGADFRTFIYAKYPQELLDVFALAVSGETIEREILTSTVYGEDIWFMVKMYPVFDKHQQLLGVVVQSFSIDEKKNAEISMQESEMKFRRIIETAPIAILIVDNQMKITLCNPETEKIFGYTCDELFNQHIDLLIPQRFKNSHHLHTAEYLEMPRMYQMGAGRFIPSITKEGKEIIVEVSLNAFVINGKQLVLAMIQDVTGRIHNEIQLKEQVQILEKIAWQHSHEIRRPVANIKGLIDLINMDYEAIRSIPTWTFLEQEVETLDKVIHKIVADTYRDYKGKK
ncbi:PAS domain S-box protein [Flectobacillus longus]|uniref:PAS domain S-box protein n=1 Tax=Flectobacillus longus TaxID=2984207 RepID=UPI0024B71801|nr:PAS domain S-box protein [Flectobacillus longus]MDI9881941.1 PAS domain S-box protein [Flectobacillus longus]